MPDSSKIRRRRSHRHTKTASRPRFKPSARSKGNASNAVILMALVGIVSVLFLTLRPSSGTEKTSFASSTDADANEPVPRAITFHTPMLSDTTFPCRVIMNVPVKTDTTVQLHCTSPLVTEANHNTFPKTVLIKKGFKQGLVILHTGSLAKDTTVTLGAGSPTTGMKAPDGTKAPDGWEAQTDLVILGTTTKHPKLHRD